MIATALVSWPSAPLTRRLVLAALQKLELEIEILESLKDKQYEQLIQWSTYDEIDHELTNVHRESVLASSYTFRKALIRKHYLAHSVHMYLTKNPASALQAASPRTYVLDLAFADELDEKWADDLYELGCFLESEPEKWWILKPGMADRGFGIRIFNTKEALQQIFEEFEISDSEDEEENIHPENEESGICKTTIVTSQLRHFVIQEYVLSPLLLDPREAPLDGNRWTSTPKLQGHKFHLRAYCLASGALQLYLYDRILALFCSEPYSRPGADGESGEKLYPVNLEAHLTNTSLQTGRGEQGVRLFDELVGCQVLDKNDNSARTFTKNDLGDIIYQITRVLRETFRAALQTTVHFQPLENAFELYGVDFLVEYIPSDISSFRVIILEVNAEPAIELTGPRLTWILEDLFASVAKVCVRPFITKKFVSDVYGQWNVGESKEHLIKCLDETVRAGPGGPFA